MRFLTSQCAMKICYKFRLCKSNYKNDGSRSTVIAMQVEVANHSKVLYSKDMVLSVREKGVYQVAETAR